METVGLPMKKPSMVKPDPTWKKAGLGRIQRAPKDVERTEETRGIALGYDPRFSLSPEEQDHLWVHGSFMKAWRALRKK